MHDDAFMQKNIFYVKLQYNVNLRFDMYLLKEESLFTVKKNDYVFIFIDKEKYDYSKKRTENTYPNKLMMINLP